MLQRAVVVLEAELAQTEERERAAVLRRQAGHAPERVAAFGKFLERVIRRALVPVALDEVGPELHRLGVERDRVFPPLGTSRLNGSLNNLIELSSGRPRRWRRLRLAPTANLPGRLPGRADGAQRQQAVAIAGIRHKRATAH